VKIDQAALLGAALAAAVGMSAAEGAWEPIESVIGLVLLLIVHAFYDVSAARTRPGWHLVKYAVSGVLALIWCLVAAWPVQWVLGLVGRPGWLQLILTVIAVLVFAAEVILLTRNRRSLVGDKIRRVDAWLSERVRPSAVEPVD
jgi:hypothetical protein